MKDLNRWILLAVIILASIAVAVDHITHHRPKADAQGGQLSPDGEVETGAYGSLPDDDVEVGGYGSVSDDDTYDDE